MNLTLDGRLIAALVLCFMAVGCDTAATDFKKCQKLESSDPEAALKACEAAIKKDATTDSGKAATAKVPEIKKAIAELEKQRAEEAAKKAAEEKAARIAAAKAEREKWKALPKKLGPMIRKQGMWDLGRGTVTRAIDVITKEIGEPTKTYEAAYGSIHVHVWGADFGSEPSMEEIKKKAPFSVHLLRDMVCGDYTGGSIEFYSYGERIWS